MDSSIDRIFNSEMRKLGHQLVQFDWENPRKYAFWLAQSYYYVCHSTRLLAAAASRYGVEQNQLHLRSLEHMREERSHEVLALNDLKRLKASVETYPELPVTAAFYQSQYFLIEHRDPSSLFGYILCLEGMSVQFGSEIYRRAEATFGKEACSFLRVHATEDEDHLPKAFEQIKKFSAHELKCVETSLIQTAGLYSEILDQIARCIELPTIQIQPITRLSKPPTDSSEASSAKKDRKKKFVS